MTQVIATFHVRVFTQDDDGSRDLIGDGYFHAPDVRAAEELARTEHWDERMTGHYLCTFLSEEVDVDTVCTFCMEEEAEGECGDCGVPVCEGCHSENTCCGGPRKESQGG